VIRHVGQITQNNRIISPDDSIRIGAVRHPRAPRFSDSGRQYTGRSNDRVCGLARADRESRVRRFVSKKRSRPRGRAPS
jgi:hypothetical protein